MTKPKFWRLVSCTPILLSLTTAPTLRSLSGSISNPKKALNSEARLVTQMHIVNLDMLLVVRNEKDSQSSRTRPIADINADLAVRGASSHTLQILASHDQR